MKIEDLKIGMCVYSHILKGPWQIQSSGIRGLKRGDVQDAMDSEGNLIHISPIYSNSRITLKVLYTNDNYANTF